MKGFDILKTMPEQGFLKVVSRTNDSLTSEQKALLSRRGNFFFRNGDIEQARKIFVTIGYSDGLIRVGDWYMERGNPYEAYRMYKLAPAPEKAELIIKRMAEVISRLIKE
jgi:hypothetical protein